MIAPGVGGAGIEAHAEAGRAAVRGDRAVVGDEVVLRILGGDAALQRMGADADVRLRAARRCPGVPMRAPPAMRICALTRSMPVAHSVTVCSTWMRGLTSMK